MHVFIFELTNNCLQPGVIVFLPVLYLKTWLWHQGRGGDITGALTRKDMSQGHEAGR